jgi:hypothetical protein
MNLREIGLKVEQRRADLGLSQDRLAKLVVSLGQLSIIWKNIYRWAQDMHSLRLAWA